jgi:uncharacterized small protein (DUF1192 family)
MTAQALLALLMLGGEAHAQEAERQHGLDGGEPLTLDVVDEAEVAAAEAVSLRTLDSVEALERRIALLEERLAATSAEVQPNRVGRGAPVVVAAGEQVQEAMSMGGLVDVSGTVLGSAVAMGSDVRVRDGGRVMGDAVAFGGRVVVDPGGEVLGDRVTMGALPDAEAPIAAMIAPTMPGTWLLDSLHAFARRLAVLLSVAGCGVLVVGIWPGRVQAVGLAATQQPVWYALAGGILSVSMTLGSLLLALTLVGLPASILLVTALAVAWLLGTVALCRAVGDRIEPVARLGPWAAFLAGMAVLGAVSLLPVVGPVFGTLAGLVAVGAGLVTRLGGRTID